MQAVLGGPWDGPVSWRKPTTFGVSFGVTLISVTWMSSFLRVREPVRRRLLGGLAAASVAGVALIVLQAWRRVPSHFNLETTLDATIARVLAAGGGVLIVVLTGMFVLSLRRQPHLPRIMTLAIRFGFGTLLGALAVGAVMIVMGMVQVLGGDQQAAYAVGGTFKLAHFVAMHGIAIQPGLAWLTRFTTWTDQRRRRVVTLGATGYLTLAATTVLAFTISQTRPALTPLAWAAAAGGAAALLAAGALTLTALTTTAGGRDPGTTNRGGADLGQRSS